MTNLMNEMIREAFECMKANDACYGFAHRDANAGEITCRILDVSTNATQTVQKIWYLNGKRIAAAKLAAM
jgi:hypothetical protein